MSTRLPPASFGVTQLPCGKSQQIFSTSSTVSAQNVQLVTSQTALPPTEKAQRLLCSRPGSLNIGTISRAALLIYAYQKRDVPVEVLEALRVELQAQLDQNSDSISLNSTPPSMV
ncbi:hypothetical protein Hypma_000073 [Hypsizygus marmoreus]|uniref:Uncharacterized protein n=1 Tax=Hypsizygus marmoreus TaxID=39966 RepID=A0A369KAZ9_HYPMA|nr:hypothetical protein Hypma_000073 [Hypsizygus marmoreus]